MKNIDEIRIIDKEEAKTIREALICYSYKYKAKDVKTKEYMLVHQMIKDLGYFLCSDQD
jgi:hypothetical protein